MPKKRNKERILKSSGNVFADLGLPNAREKQAKVRLALAVNDILAARGLSQLAASRQLRIGQPKVSALHNYRLAGFSLERLLHLLNRLGCDVEIVVSLKRRRGLRTKPRILVSAA